MQPVEETPRVGPWSPDHGPWDDRQVSPSRGCFGSAAHTADASPRLSAWQ
jgi:hypothetical protein